MANYPIHHHLSANGIRVHAIEWGIPRAVRASAGPPVVLLHGLTSCAETWSFVAPALAGLGHRAVAVDLRGHGDTEKPDAGYDYDSVSSDVIGLMDALSIDRAVVVGQSYGAGVAADVAGRAPNRVSHVAFVDGGFFRNRAPAEMTDEQLEGMLAPIEIYATQESYLNACFSSFPGPRTPELTRIYLASIYHNEDGSVREKLSREHQKLIAREMVQGRGRDRYQQIECPVMILPAHNSAPGAAQRMAEKVTRVEEVAALLPNATVRWVQDTVHDIQLHKPDEVVAGIRALAAGD